MRYLLFSICSLFLPISEVDGVIWKASSFEILSDLKPPCLQFEIDMATLPIAMKSAAESTDTITELLWQDALRHLKSTNNEVLLPINVTDMIGQGNVDKIKTRLG